MLLGHMLSIMSAGPSLVVRTSIIPHLPAFATFEPFCSFIITASSLMAGDWGFQEQFGQAFLPDSDPHLFPGDGVPIFDVPNEAVDSTLDTGGLGNDDNYANPPPNVLSYVSADVNYGDV